jgi:predicted secreted hydrolase
MSKIKFPLIGILVVIIISVIIGGFINRDDTRVRASLGLAAVSDTQIAKISGYQRASGPIPMTFPEDFGPHPGYQTEWWYYTGNLDAPDGRHFGYQLTFFRRALLPPDLIPERASDLAAGQVYMAHFAITDVGGNKHYAFENLGRGAGGIAGAQADPYQVWLEDWRVEEIGPGEYRLVASQDGVKLDLQMKDQKGPILHGVEGYSQKGADPGNASYYYSQTRLATEGTISIANQEYDVTGLSWKDHEYSTSALSPGQVGWDWFSIQLDNQQELMLFQIRNEDGSIDPYSSGTLIMPNGDTIHLEKDEFEIEVKEHWKSPYSGATYPSAWLIQVPSQDISLEIVPHLNDQEMKLAYTYWEGAVRVSGEQGGEIVTGNGYAELTGYAGSMSGEF